MKLGKATLTCACKQNKKGIQDMKKALPTTKMTLRLYPLTYQQEKLKENFEAYRLVYNYYLDIRKNKWNNEKVTFTFNDCIKDLPSYRKRQPRLQAADSQALRCAIKELDNDYSFFFKFLHNYPQQKLEENNGNYYRTTNCNNSIRFAPNGIILPKIGRIPLSPLSSDIFNPKTKVIDGRIVSAEIKQESPIEYYCTLRITDVPKPTKEEFPIP